MTPSASAGGALQPQPCILTIFGGDGDLADRFAGRTGLRGAARFEGLDWTRLATGAPLLPNAVAMIDCELEETIAGHFFPRQLAAIYLVSASEVDRCLFRRVGRIQAFRAIGKRSRAPGLGNAGDRRLLQTSFNRVLAQLGDGRLGPLIIEQIQERGRLKPDFLVGIVEALLQ